MRKFKNILINENRSISYLIKKFNKFAYLTNGKGFCVVENNNKKVIGVVTDGDLRRAIGKKIPLETKISEITNNKFISVKENTNFYDILIKFENKIPFIPVINNKGKLIDIHTYTSFLNYRYLDKKIIRSSVPARVSFSGGGTDFSHLIDINNTSILSATITKQCTSSLLIRDDKKINIISKDLNLKYTAENINKIKSGDHLDLIKSAIKIMRPNFGFDLEIVSDLEPGTGLGSSSAITVSVIGLLNYFRNENNFDKHSIADLAYQSERIESKITGGWQDQYSTTFGGFNFIEFKKNEVVVNPLRLDRNVLLELEFNLLFFKIGKSRDSSKIQKNILKNKSLKSKADLKNYIKKVNKLTNDMKNTLLSGDVKQFGDLLNDSWELKKIINNNVTNSKIDKCYKKARKIGALGGKILGAGQSGYLMIYTSPKFKKEIIFELENLGLKYENIKFTKNGLEVWATKR